MILVFKTDNGLVVGVNLINRMMKSLLTLLLVCKSLYSIYFAKNKYILFIRTTVFVKFFLSEIKTILFDLFLSNKYLSFLIVVDIATAEYKSFKRFCVSRNSIFCYVYIIIKFLKAPTAFSFHFIKYLGHTINKHITPGHD